LIYNKFYLHNFYILHHFINLNTNQTKLTRFIIEANTKFIKITNTSNPTKIHPVYNDFGLSESQPQYKKKTAPLITNKISFMMFKKFMTQV